MQRCKITEFQSPFTSGHKQCVGCCPAVLIYCTWAIASLLGSKHQIFSSSGCQCSHLHFCSRRPPSFLFKTLLTGGITQAQRNKRDLIILFLLGRASPVSSQGIFFTRYLVCSFCASRVTSPFLEYCWVQFTDGFIQLQWFISSLRNEVENYCHSYDFILNDNIQRFSASFACSFLVAGFVSSLWLLSEIFAISRWFSGCTYQNQTRFCLDDYLERDSAKATHKTQLVQLTFSLIFCLSPVFIQSRIHTYVELMHLSVWYFDQANGI